jgi:hypothetical protein
MLKEAGVGIFPWLPDNIIAEFPQFPVTSDDGGADRPRLQRPGKEGRTNLFWIAQIQYNHLAISDAMRRLCSLRRHVRNRQPALVGQ